MLWMRWTYGLTKWTQLDSAYTLICSTVGLRLSYLLVLALLPIFSSMVIQSLLSHGLCTVQKIGYGPFRNSSVGLMMNEFYQSRFIFEQWYWFYMMFIPYYDDNKFIQQCYDYSFPIMTIYSLLWWVLNSILNIHLLLNCLQ